jgi:hypothetical protein
MMGRITIGKVFNDFTFDNCVTIDDIIEVKEPFGPPSPLPPKQDINVLIDGQLCRIRTIVKPRQSIWVGQNRSQHQQTVRYHPR